MRTPKLCQQFRDQLELRAAEALPAREWEQHAASCADCAQYGELQRWSHAVVTAAEIEVQPPLMSAVWASIHRASEQAWDSALTRSFRYLLPYMVAVVALVLLISGLTMSHAPTPVQAASTAYAVLNQPETPNMADVVNVTAPSQDPTVLLGVGNRP